MENVIKKIPILILCVTCCTKKAHAQVSDELRQTIEKYLENTESTADFTQVTEDLGAYLEKPINLNTATLDELINFPLINPSQAIKIIAHRNTYGLYLSINELQVVGISVEQLRMVRPFISIAPSVSQQWKYLLRQSNSGITEIISTSKYKLPITENDSFFGNYWNQNVRLRYTKPGLYSFGITADKDAGEAYWKRGPDFISAHAMVQNIGIIKAVVVGDYVLSLGQGLVMGSGIGMGKSAMVMNIKRTAPNLKAYRGVNEFFFLRGTALSLQIKKWNVIIAGSINTLDATLKDSSDAMPASYSALDLDGLHRNTKEVAKKGNLKQSMLGSWIQKQGRKGSWGVGGNVWQYSNPIGKPTEPYKKFYPYGNMVSFLNAFQAHTIGRFHLFSELAYCTENGRKAGVVGILTSLGKNAEVSMLYRNYESGFNSPFSTGFGNSSQNERGLYTGIKIHFTRKLWLSNYTDFWMNPWLGYRIYAPARGTDMLWQLDCTPAKQSQIYVRLRVQNKPYNSGESEPMKTVSELKITSVRLHCTVPVTVNLSWQMRGESSLATVPGNTYRASLVFMQLSGRIKRLKTFISARYTLYNVPFYYNRIYVFENQLAYDFGTVAFYGKGYSYYILATQKINKKWQGAVRYSITNMLSADATAVDKKQSFNIQLSYKIWTQN